MVCVIETYTKAAFKYKIEILKCELPSSVKGNARLGVDYQRYMYVSANIHALLRRQLFFFLSAYSI